jgi:hypothetical protein
MPLRNHTGIVPQRLNGVGGGQTQTWVAGQKLAWAMKGIRAVTDGKLCNYLIGLCVTVTGRILVGLPDGPTSMFPGSHAARNSWRTQWDILRSLFASLEVTGAWHGTPLSSQHVKGSFLQLIEWVGNGMERPYRQSQPLTVAREEQPVARYFRYNMFVPLCLLAGAEGHHTALPAAMYRDAVFEMQCAATATGPISSDTISAVAVDVSALLLPENEVRVGPSVQWIDYQQAVAGEAVTIDNMGVKTTVDMVDKGAGIVGAFWLSDRLGLPGPAMARDLADITVPWRGIVHTRHVDPLLLQLEAVTSGQYQPAGQSVDIDPDGSDERSGDVAGFPYDDFDYGNSESGATNALAALPRNPVVIPLACPSRDLKITKVQVIEGTQEVQLQFRDAILPISGTHHILCCQLHSWNPAGWASAKQLLIESGVCRAVLGTDDVDWKLKMTKKQDPVDSAGASKVKPTKLRLLPMTLQPVSGAREKVA